MKEKPNRERKQKKQRERKEEEVRRELKKLVAGFLLPLSPLSHSSITRAVSLYFFSMKSAVHCSMVSVGLLFYCHF